MLKIGSVQLKNRLIQAPMAGVSDLPFRLLCHEQGAALVSMEMVSAKAITYHNKNTAALMRTDDREHPVSLQLFGSDPEILADVAARLDTAPFDILDFNMGCPVPKVVNNGEGSALMRDPAKAAGILSALVRATRKPVTVKIRKGFNENEVNAVEIARIAEACGVAAIAVHGRTREQYYSGRADWEVIRQVKEAVSIPVIGNGDVDTPQAAAAMFAETGCDGVMIGRGCQGDPWLFSRTLRFLEDGTVLPKPAGRELLKMILRHAQMELDLKGEYTAVREMRKHISWYTAGLPGGARLRRDVNEAVSMEQVKELLDRFLLERSPLEEPV